jgi:hypothetical protein
MKTRIEKTEAASRTLQPKKRKETSNSTGIPDKLKTGVENLSGRNLDNVKVHYNSPKPAQLQAHAYTQGTEIHVAPGQEHHLPHEAWHVVQQMQGRVQPTVRTQGVNINDSPTLEHEADIMGAKAVQMKNYNLSVRKTGVINDMNNWNTVRANLVNNATGAAIAKGGNADPTIAGNTNNSLAALHLQTGNRCMSAHMIPNRIGGLGDNTNVRPWDQAFERGTWETHVEKVFGNEVLNAAINGVIPYNVTTTDMTDEQAQQIVDRSPIVAARTNANKDNIKKIPLLVTAQVGNHTLNATNECSRNLIPHLLDTNVLIDFPHNNDNIGNEYSIKMIANASTNNVRVKIQKTGTTGIWNQARQDDTGTWWYDWKNIENGQYEIIAESWNVAGQRFETAITSVTKN